MEESLKLLYHTMPPELHHERIMSFQKNLSFLSWSEYRHIWPICLSLPTWAYCLRAKILPTSSKCFFSYSPQLELGILQPCHHKSAGPLCSCWPSKNNWEGSWVIYMHKIKGNMDLLKINRYRLGFSRCNPYKSLTGKTRDLRIYLFLAFKVHWQSTE